MHGKRNDQQDREETGSSPLFALAFGLNYLLISDDVPDKDELNEEL